MTALLGERTGVPDRFHAPLYSVADAARYLGVPQSTLREWTHGYRRPQPGRPDVTGQPVLTSVRTSPAQRRAMIPFIGLAEGMVLTAMRSSGVPLQRVRPALARLDAEFGLRHALASKKLYSDGAEILYDYAKADADTEESEACANWSSSAAVNGSSTTSSGRT